MASPCRTRGRCPRLGFAAAARLGRVTLERPKVTKGLIPQLFALLRRVPSVHPFVPRHRSQLTAPVIYSEQRSGGLLSLIWPLAHPMARADCRSYATGVIDMVAQGENNCEYNSKLHTSLSGNGFILKARQ